MTMKKPNLKLIIALLLMGIGIGLFQVFLMPPFQDPDEIQHFLYSASYAYDARQMETVEAQVLEVLKKSKWFHYVGFGPGWEKIQKISDVAYVFHFDPGRQTARKTVFHYLYGKILKITGITAVLPAFYYMRLVSTAFFLIILLLLYWYYYHHYSEIWEYLFFGTVLVYQFLTQMNAVNYDVLMVLCGVLFFHQAHRYLQTRENKYLAGIVAAAAVGTFIKLTGVLFFLYLIILLAIKPKGEKKQAGNFILVILAVVMGFCWLNYIFPERFFHLYSIIFDALKETAGSGTAPGGKAAGLNLLNSLVDSFYFQTGWMGYKLKVAWYVVLKLFLVLSVVGVILALLIKTIKIETPKIEKIKEKVPGKKNPETERRWLIYCLVVSGLQGFFTWSYYGAKIAVQGRYMYPLIIPIMVLVYTGLHYIEKVLRIKGKQISTLYILFQVVMVLAAVVRIISVFYLEIASPHPGL